MVFSLEQIQEDILTYLDTVVFPAEEVVEQAIPDINTVKRNGSGLIDPYVVVQIGDIQPWGSTSFVGPRGDDYVLPLYLQVVSPIPKLSRRLQNQAIDRFLGASFPWAGQIRKRVSGGQMPITNSDGTVECYINPVSFGIVVQLATIP